MTRYCVEHAIANSGHDNIELLVLDNSSLDDRVVHWGESIADKHFTNGANEGIAGGYNKLFREATGDYLCTISNDMLLSPNWLKDMIRFNQLIPKSGITAIHCLLDKGEFDGLVYAPKTGLVYSNYLFSREVFEKVGILNPVFEYGYDDSEYCFRVNMAGYRNYYIPWHYCIHAGEDFNKDDTYRQMKDQSLKDTKILFEQSIAHIRKTGNYYMPI